MNEDSINSAVAAVNFGTATAVKRGRRPEWPYVPIVDHGSHTEQLLGVAYATRVEAVQCAERTIAARREFLGQQLRNPRYRALREQHGLPREIA